METLRLKICNIESIDKRISIFVREIRKDTIRKRRRRRILSFSPDDSLLKEILSFFGVDNAYKLIGKIFEIPEKNSATNLAFEYLYTNSKKPIYWICGDQKTYLLTIQAKKED